jgi:hypothetical protein
MKLIGGFGDSIARVNAEDLPSTGLADSNDPAWCCLNL